MKKSDQSRNLGTRLAYELVRDSMSIINRAKRGKKDKAFYARVRRVRRLSARYRHTDKFFRRVYREMGILLQEKHRQDSKFIWEEGDVEVQERRNP